MQNGNCTRPIAQRWRERGSGWSRSAETKMSQPLTPLFTVSRAHANLLGLIWWVWFKPRPRQKERLPRTKKAKNKLTIWGKKLWPSDLPNSFFKELTFRSESVLQDNLVDNLSTGNASPSEIVFGLSVELFISHWTTATTTFHHGCLPLIILIYALLFEISMLMDETRNC